MKRTILFSAIFVCFLSISCEKETSDAPPDPVDDSTANFSVLGTDADCSTIETSGTYHVGTALSATEFMKINVAVTRKGTWKYSTDTLNGYYFSASGTFDSTGDQEITLTASGTPLFPGNNRFSFSRTSTELHQVVSVIESDVVLEDVPDQLYFKGTVGDDEFNVVYPVTVDHVSYGFGGTDTISFNSFVGPGTFPNPPGTGSLTIQIGYLYNYPTSTEADFRELFSPKAYPVAHWKCVTSYLSSGALISWIDDQGTGEGWYTQYELDQTGSYFKIVGMEDGHRTDGKYFVKVRSRFHCKLYHYPDHVMKEIEGEAVSCFIRPELP